MKTSMIGKMTAALAAVVLGANVASAAIIQTDASTPGTDTAYTSGISSVDLINSGQTSFASMAYTGTLNWAGSQVAINDGFAVSGSPGPAGGNVALLNGIAGGSGPWTFTYNLNLGVGGSATGYDITGVNSFFGWNGPPLATQSWEMQVATIANPTFTIVTTVSYDPFGDPDIGSGSSKVSLTSNSGPIATGVTAVRFLFNVPSDPNATDFNHQSVVQEIDVLGAATIPEPASGLMLLGSMLGLGVLRRKLRG